MNIAIRITTALVATLLAVRVAAVEARTADPDLYADPIPRRIVAQAMARHGFTAAQAALFRVVRRVPIELGGTNAPDNLLVLGRADAAAHEQRVQTVLRWVRENRMTIATAVASLMEEHE